MEKITAIYHISAPAGSIEKITREIAFEQTVEVPEHLVQSQHILDQVVGRVTSLKPFSTKADVFEAEIQYNAELAYNQLPQLLNLVYGNISIKNNVKLVDVQLPDSFVNGFRGPNFGIEGIRRLLGCYGRPLLATALKPRGTAPRDLAAMAYQFALGGGDIVKDDHNLIDASFEQFQHRVQICLEAVQKANATTHHNTLYFPNLLVSQHKLEKHLEWLCSVGIRGVLISPFLTGLDTLRVLSEKYPLVYMAHPSFGGTFFHDRKHGIDPGILLGQFFRLSGADITVFPNAGGRFSFLRPDCQSIIQHARKPMAHLRPCFPAPAGGMKFQNLADMSKQFGPDAIFLIGGALMGYSKSLSRSTEAFLQKITEFFPQSYSTSPRPDFLSACEFSSTEIQQQVYQILPFNKDFSWQGRSPRVYKSSGHLPFKQITRHELIGQQGERTQFDLRYFQIEPDGYSSLEKHYHTHAIICVRGRGELQIDGQVFTLEPLDIAYVPPLAVHQLRNAAREPFGFFCIVDHHRDKPMKP